MLWLGGRLGMIQLSAALLCPGSAPNSGSQTFSFATHAVPSTAQFMLQSYRSSSHQSPSHSHTRKDLLNKLSKLLRCKKQCNRQQFWQRPSFQEINYLKFSLWLGKVLQIPVQGLHRLMDFSWWGLLSPCFNYGHFQQVQQGTPCETKPGSSSPCTFQIWSERPLILPPRYIQRSENETHA